MQKFIIERTVPGAGALTPEEIASITEASNNAISGLGVRYVWHESYAAGDKIYCVHSAESADVIREHARRGGFPVDTVTPVATEFGPEAVSA